VIAHCSCGASFWTDTQDPSCPSCDWPALVRSRFEALDEFEKRLGALVQTRAQIRALPEAA
jgi:hypothetical protein